VPNVIDSLTSARPARMAVSHLFPNSRLGGPRSKRARENHQAERSAEARRRATPPGA